MKEIRGRLFAPALRGLDACLPPAALYRLLWPIAVMRAAIHRLAKGRPHLPPWPSCIPIGNPPKAPALQRLPVYLQRPLEFLPDRLALPRWRQRCRVDGLAPLREAVERRRPVLLGFCHFGPVAILRSWLRAEGVPVVGFAGGQATGRTELARRKDKWALFPEVPPAVYQDQLDDAIRLLRDGKPLMIALDIPSGHQVGVPVRDGWTFQMPTGAMRMAARHNAELFACTIVDEGAWRFRLHLSDPVPRGLLTTPSQAEAGAHLLNSMMPHFAAHPDHWHRDLFERFHPPAASSQGSQA